MTGPLPHGNLGRRLLDVRDVRAATATPEQVFWVRMVAERLGVDLLTFWTGNSVLCEGICADLDRLDAARAGAGGASEDLADPATDLAARLDQVYDRIRFLTLGAPYLRT